MIKTDTKLKTDDTPCELYTLQEIYDKVGGFPFTVIKLIGRKDPCFDKQLPQFSCKTVTGFYRRKPGHFRISPTMHSPGNIRQWGLLK